MKKFIVSSVPDLELLNCISIDDYHSLIEGAKEIDLLEFIHNCIINLEALENFEEYPEDYKFYKNANIYFYEYYKNFYFYKEEV